MINKSRQYGRISGKALLVIVLLLAIIGLLTFMTLDKKPSGDKATSSGSKTAQEAGDTFMNAASKKNAETSYALFTDEFKQKLSAESWKAQLDFLFEGNAISSPSFAGSVDVEGSNPEAKVLTYTLTRTGANTITYDISLTIVKVGDAWKISKVTDRERT